MPKRAAKSGVKNQSPPWWLSGGEEECPHCGQLYAYEVEVRCTDCDSPSCPHCIVTHTEYRSCVSCASDAEEAS